MRIQKLTSEDEARRCAEMMASSEPWTTIGRSFEHCLALIQRPDREVYVAGADNQILGFIILVMTGAFVGYIQIICVAPDARSRGVGSELIAFAEERIFRETKNVFLCVSSFNPRARALYERLGYECVGELKDYLIAGASEFLMRKTLGPFLAPGRPGV